MVNEAYIRLVDYKRMQWQNRAHFFAVSAQLMRRILVERARRRNLKRGRGAQHVPLDETAVVSACRHNVPLDETAVVSACRHSAAKETVMRTVNLRQQLTMFDDYWQPRTIAQFNGHDIMVVKAKGDFVWHSHDETDDLFLVLEGRLTIELRDGRVQLGPGDLFVVPRSVEHRPVADEEVHLLLIEPTGTPNTGDAATAAPRRAI